MGRSEIVQVLLLACLFGLVAYWLVGTLNKPVKGPDIFTRLRVGQRLPLFAGLATVTFLGAFVWPHIVIHAVDKHTIVGAIIIVAPSVVCILVSGGCVTLLLLYFLLRSFRGMD